MGTSVKDNGKKNAADIAERKFLFQNVRRRHQYGVSKWQPVKVRSSKNVYMCYTAFPAPDARIFEKWEGASLFLRIPCRSSLIIGIGNGISIIVVVFMGVIELGVLPHQQIGFYCNDPRISLPFTGDTISISVLIGGSIILPLVVMWAAEWTCHKSDSYRSLRPGCAGTRGKQIWSWYGHYTIGIIAVTCICDFAKILIGAPRPHFLKTCRPLEWENCTDAYIQSYTCTNKEQAFWFVMDASKSFPSGHSALSMFTSIYLIWYIQNRLPRRTTAALLKPWTQCLVLFWGIVCSLTRITDNRHHWWDVLAGVLIGIAAAIYCVIVNCKGFVLKDVGAGWAHTEPVENGHHGYDSRRHQSVRKLLSNTSAEIREMGDVVTTWKE